MVKMVKLRATSYQGVKTSQVSGSNHQSTIKKQTVKVSVSTHLISGSVESLLPFSRDFITTGEKKTLVESFCNPVLGCIENVL